MYDEINLMIHNILKFQSMYSDNFITHMYTKSKQLLEIEKK